jgi:hypothetical protein
MCERRKAGANRHGDERHVRRHKMREGLGRVKARSRNRAKGNGGRKVGRQNANASGLVPLRL